MGVRYHAASGRYCADRRVTLRHLDGRVEKRHLTSYHRTKEAASQAQRRLEEEAIVMKALARRGQLPERAPAAAHKEEEQAAPVLESFVQRWQRTWERRYSPGTRYAIESAFRCYILPAFGDRRLDQLGAEEIDLWVQDLLDQEGPPGPKTIANALCYFKRCLDQALPPPDGWGYLRFNPASGVRAPRVMDARAGKAVDRDTAESIIEAAHASWRTFIRVAFETGMRKGELLAMWWPDVDIVNGKEAFYNVRRNLVYGPKGPEVKEPKSGRARVVPLSPACIQALRALPSRFAGRWVFCHADGEPFHPGTPYDFWADACRRVGVRLRLHDARHTFTSLMIEGGTAKELVQLMLGHSTTRMVDLYTHVRPAVLGAAVRSVFAERAV